jgi:protein-disulfide isomerase
VVDSSKRRNPKARTVSKAMRAFYVILALVAIAGIGGLTFLSTRPKEATLTAVDTTLPKVVSQGYTLGDSSAPVEVIEFADFECPACERFATLSEPDVRTRLIQTGKIRMRFVDYPLPMHKNTWFASRAAACADEQGKFWPMHDAIFASQDRWNGEATSNPNKVFKELAGPLGINQAQFDQCVDSKKYQAKVQAHQQLALDRQVPSTPSFVIGGKMHSGALFYDDFKKLVDNALAAAGSPIATGSAPAPASAPATKTPAGGTKAPARP